MHFNHVVSPGTDAPIIHQYAFHCVHCKICDVKHWNVNNKAQLGVCNVQ